MLTVCAGGCSCTTNWGHRIEHVYFSVEWIGVLRWTFSCPPLKYQCRKLLCFDHFHGVNTANGYGAEPWAVSFRNQHLEFEFNTDVLDRKYPKDGLSRRGASLILSSRSPLPKSLPERHQSTGECFGHRGHSSPSNSSQAAAAVSSIRRACAASTIHLLSASHDKAKTDYKG